ncbi:MAG: LysR family transcriptional regulator [Bradyrhizobium sp.]|uniref:LysR family transcriptional regulator n=1 Tax=Bradyrhizobium sp. TaxID=376 RepID=UPI001C29EC7C|nr:LysR family transcriptional regulator [Bradyrhizobium sp.]MBU6462757.1 LysR family transcriptional regulator [Pseudomonadota bacterium]MDE2067656.1 LysR family transcriptional regulator [Bradyrhizobium sp.]MDE2241771.1 LysR family transcriptional regulator [Bradyrhizobium sp.]
MPAGLRDLTIRQLRSLAALATGGSITAAASRVNLTQPAVTQQLRNLQDLAGLPLVQRTSEGMRLTEAGRELLALSQRIEASIATCELSLEALAGRTGGRVSIGSVSTAKYFVPYAIAAFSKLYPKIDIKLSVGNRETIRRAVHDYEMDIAIMGRPPSDVDVEVQLIGDHPHILVASGQHPVASRDVRSLSDISGEVFITREVGSGTRLLMEGLFDANGLNPKIGMEMGSNETVKQAVIAGLGVAFISAHTVASELDDGRLVMLDIEGLPVVRQWFVVRRKDKIMLPPAQAVLDFMSTQGARYLPKLSQLSR